MGGPAWEKAPGNINLEHWASPCPVDMFRGSAGICDVLGNVWQHCLTPIDILEGFQTHPLYDDFTVPTVDGYHARIMSGSWISTGANGGTRDSRYGFRRHFYQHAGFRYVESTDQVATEVVACETDRSICDAFRFHFDTSGMGSPNFPEALATTVLNAWNNAMGSSLTDVKALELGCGPGRTVLELAKQGVGQVHGADLTAKAFQRTAQQLVHGRGMLRWNNHMEGDLVDRRELLASELNLKKHADIEWHQMPDFAAIDTKKFQSYDLVVCAQPGAVRRSDPVKLLQSAHLVVRPGGLLVIGTQYDWSSGVVSTATGAEVLQHLLEPWFEVACEGVDIDFAKAETARKFECGTQHITFWRRRSDIKCAPLKQEFKESVQSNVSPGQAMYDDESVLGYYLDFHFGPASEYPVVCADLCVQAMKAKGLPMRKALDVGSGPGRSAFELSKSFEHVDSGDYSQSFVNLANKLVDQGELKWQVTNDVTGGSVTERSVSSKEIAPGSVSFRQMDAHNLPEDFNSYDLICGFNLIDRLTRPKQFLLEAHQRLNSGGLLVLSSPYTWLEQFTQKTEWLGGFKYGDNDGPSTYAGLKEYLLECGFEEAQPPQDVWMRIDELNNGRKSQQTRAEMTFWTKL